MNAEETGFYYLQSRYYNPQWGRFINADGQLAADNPLGLNLFAYCLNNPVNMVDSCGNMPKWVLGLLNIVGGTAQAAAGAALGATVGWTGAGAAIGAFLMLNGAATITQGIGQITNDIADSSVLREDNLIRTGVEETGQILGGNTGRAIAAGLYTGIEIGTAWYAGTILANQALNQYMPKVINSKLFSFNDGYGIKIGKHIEMLYRTPNSAGGPGGTIFSYKGPLGKWRLDWDPAHFFHTHPPGHK